MVELKVSWKEVVGSLGRIFRLVNVRDLKPGEYCRVVVLPSTGAMVVILETEKLYLGIRNFGFLKIFRPSQKRCYIKLNGLV